jgi:hypothetical protein
MRSLAALRHKAPYDGHFITRSPLFWPLARAAKCLVGLEDFPRPEDLDLVFEGRPPVHFVTAKPRPRRERRGPPDLRTMYDGVITLDHRVPTRPRSWHDLMNALVWGAFPNAKAALHARQHRAIVARVETGATSLPSTRSRELDALALVDEGGVVLLAHEPEEARSALRESPSSLRERFAKGDVDLVVFGHAIYESLVFDVPPARVAGMVFVRGSSPRDRSAEADRALAKALEDPSRFCSPEELLRIQLPL